MTSTQLAGTCSSASGWQRDHPAATLDKCEPAMALDVTCQSMIRASGPLRLAGLISIAACSSRRRRAKARAARWRRSRGGGWGERRPRWRRGFRYGGRGCGQIGTGSGAAGDHMTGTGGTAGDATAGGGGGAAGGDAGRSPAGNGGVGGGSARSRRVAVRSRAVRRAQNGPELLQLSDCLGRGRRWFARARLRELLRARPGWQDPRRELLRIWEAGRFRAPIDSPSTRPAAGPPGDLGRRRRQRALRCDRDDCRDGGDQIPASLHVLLGRGHGEFAPAASIPVGTAQAYYPPRVAVGDLNGDGEVDLV